MNIPSIASSKITNFISGLGNNEDSLTAMVIKDWIGDGATVYTYKKEGGKDDAKEKAIEEFGTGVVWLFGIPAVKWLVDKAVYPLFKLDSKFDPRLLSKENQKNLAKNTEAVLNSSAEALKNQKDIFSTLEKHNSVLKNFTNAQMYKGLSIAKFITSTALSAIALTKIIKAKQKSTTKRIENDAKKQLNNTHFKSSVLLENSINENKTFSNFTSNKKTNNISFTGNISEFMYNPIKNTMILDGVIASTRLIEARKGERKEVLLKELFQIGFVYGLAKPIQKGFEFLGKKMGKPINLDYKVLATKNLSEKIANAKDSIELLKNSTDKIATLSKLNINNPILELLDNDGVISTIKDKKGSIKAIDYRKIIDEDAIQNTLEKLDEVKPKLSSLKSIKAYKILASIGNVLITAAVMGILQPKINILMRKILNNGDNRNPAIISQENNYNKNYKV